MRVYSGGCTVRLIFLLKTNRASRIWNHKTVNRRDLHGPEISDFSKLTAKICSEVFTVAGCKWQIKIYPKPANSDFISVYLKSADHASLPVGWSRTVNFSLTVVSQNSHDSSITKEGSGEFTAPNCSWGYSTFMSRSELLSQYLTEDSLVIEANLAVLKAVPQVAQPPLAPRDGYSAREADKFVSYFDNLYEILGAAETSAGKEEPSPEEVENAKMCLNECLTSHFKLNMKERLASALSTLRVAEAGISPEQRKSVLGFLIHFDDYISDYLTLQQDSSVYEIRKLQNDLLFSAMKKNRERQLSYKELSEKLSQEEEELKKKLEDTRCRKSELVSDWETVIAEVEELKSKYVSKKPRLTEAEERKRISEERLSRSTPAWANLKAQFL